jgi:hypothetical protein
MIDAVPMAYYYGHVTTTCPTKSTTTHGVGRVSPPQLSSLLGTDIVVVLDEEARLRHHTYSKKIGVFHIRRMNV